MNCTGKNCIMQYDKVDPATCPCVPYCPQATPPKTNADKIRQMTDEELVSIVRCPSNIDENYAMNECLFTTCRECKLNWLKAEVKNE